MHDGEAEEVAQESVPDDLDHSPDFDPTDPKPVPAKLPPVPASSI